MSRATNAINTIIAAYPSLAQLFESGTSLRASLSLDEAEAAAGDFAKASKSVATIRAYRSDARDFSAWCARRGLEPLPACVETVAAYLASLATSGAKSSTITRRRAAIAFMHRVAGFEAPTGSEAVKAVLAGIRRSLGTAVTRKSPATAETIRAIVAEMPPICAACVIVLSCS